MKRLFDISIYITFIGVLVMLVGSIVDGVIPFLIGVLVMMGGIVMNMYTDEKIMKDKYKERK